MRGGVFITGAVLACITGGLAGADYWFIERTNPAYAPTEEITEEIPSPEPVLVTGSGTASQGLLKTTSGASFPQKSGSVATIPLSPIVKKGMSLKKAQGPNVANVISTSGLTQTDTKELSLLSLSAPPGTVQTVVLMRQNDRLALFAWTESDNVKTLFSALKEALQMQFSPQIKDLLDETRTQETGPPFDILSFTDPKISPEKVIFLRVRTRLYEFHVAALQEALLEKMMESLRQ